MSTSWWEKNLEKFGRCWEHAFYTLIILKSYQKISEKKLFNIKTGNVTFLAQNWFVNLAKYIWIFSDFLIIFDNLVYRENVWVEFERRFDGLSRNFLSVERIFFAKTYPNFLTFDRFFKTKKKFWILEKNLKKFTCTRRKKHGIIPRNFVVLYNGSCSYTERNIS